MSKPAVEPGARVALVTGSAHGLGKAVAEHLAARGDRVHVVWNSSHARAAELEERFPGRVHRADLTGERAADELARAVLAHDGRLDVCVHAVGDYLPATLEETSRAALEHLFASNVASSFSVFAAVRSALRASRGNAVFFGCAGLEGLRARRETAAYGALKSALCVLVRSWALEEAPHGVRVNLVSPGLVPHAHASSDTLDPAKQARLPFGRPGTPDEVARAVVFLTSPDAAYTTGVDLSVAGGWML